MKTEGVLKAILLRLYISERLFKSRSLYLSSISDITVSICVPNYIYVYKFFYWERDSDQFFYISNEDRKEDRDRSM